MLVWLGALAIGISLGLLGSSGSIFTVPALVYLAHEDEKVAIASSLGIVAGISLVAAVPYARRGEVDWRSVLRFGVPGIVGTYGGAWLGGHVSARFQLALLAVVMIAACGLMLRKPCDAG
ncbi:MAG: sulfite exporter TauE/SafE family protein, partial [Planctomycetota bacterium]